MNVMLDMSRLRGEMRYGEPLARYTSWRVGGAARQFYRPADSADLTVFLQHLPQSEPLFWLGLGSNLLVRDEDFDGTVIATLGALEGLEMLDEKLLRTEAGVTCARVARLAARKGLCGLEFLAGIPGTMGGALAMNAGAFGDETWKRINWVETIDRHGVVTRRTAEAFTIGYRTVEGLEDEWFLAAAFELEPGDVAAGQQKIKQLLERRSITQPIGLPSCGSVFRNPQGGHAARLIERAGLKGACIGGAQVSEKHANFIINNGNATADDIERLINRVRRIVAIETGVQLETEVIILGRCGRVN